MLKVNIINDVDLYYQLNTNESKNSNNHNSKDDFNFDEINNNDNDNDDEYIDRIKYNNSIKKQINKKETNFEIELGDYDINDYERMIESMYENDSENENDSDKIKLIKNKNGLKTKKKKLYCDSCNNDDLVEDTSHGILVCKSCGQVVANLMDCGAEWTQYNDDNKKDMNRCSHPISQLLPQSSAATTIAGACSSRIKTLHGWSAMPYKERSLNDVFKVIQKKCNNGKIMKCIEDDAKIMYKNISDCKHISGKNEGKSIIIRGKNRMSVIAACVLFACRKKDKARSPKEIAELFDLKYTEITKGCKIFQKLAKLKNMELKLNSTKPEHFILRFCEELKIKKEYTNQTIKISNNVQKLQIASVHTPLSLATGSIYLMIHLNNLSIQKKVIADKFNVSQVTIAKAFKKLEPFMNLLTNDELCDRLSIEIKKYQNQIVIPEELKSKFSRFNIDIDKINKNEIKIPEQILTLIPTSTQISKKIISTNNKYDNINNISLS